MSQKQEREFWEAMNSYKSICKILNTAMPGQSFTVLAFSELFQFKPIEAKPLLDSMLSMCFLTYELSSLTYRVVASKEERLVLAKRRLADINKLNAEIIKEHLRISEMMQLDLGWIPLVSKNKESKALTQGKAVGEVKTIKMPQKAMKSRKTVKKGK